MQFIGAWLVVALFFPFITGFVDTPPENTEQTSTQEADLFPEGPLFYAPLASPKEPRTHVTWLRLNLPGESINVGSVGFGDSFGLVRWPGWGETDAWQLDLSGAVLAQFNLDSDSMDLVNADYIIGLPISYRNGPWSARGRVFHQSSHLGDEFLLLPQSPELKQTRLNLSFETVELLGGWEWESIRLSAGPSYSVQGGIDYLRTKPVYTPSMHLFASVLCHAWEETGWNPDVNAKAGVNIRSPYTEKRSI